MRIFRILTLIAETIPGRQSSGVSLSSGWRRTCQTQITQATRKIAVTTLNPDIPAPDLTAALDEAANAMRAFGHSILTPELLLYTFASSETYNASRLLRHLSRERGFDLKQFAQAVENMARLRNGRDGRLSFTTTGGEVPLSDELIIVLDEGRGIAQALDEVQVGTHHALGAMSERGVSTSAFLQRHGVTPEAMTDQLMAAAAIRKQSASDLVSQAQSGELKPVYYRQDLLRDLSTLLALAGHRHILLIGPPGVGKRSLVQSLGLLLAEGKGPSGLKSLVTVNESALLADAALALEAGIRQAQGGILFLPNIQRFFGGILDAVFPKAEKTLQKAFLGKNPVVIGTLRQEDFDKFVAKVPAVVESVQRLEVPEPSVKETAAILAVHQPHLEAEYRLHFTARSMETAATYAKRYLTETPLPASALQLLHRSCALVRAGAQQQNPFRPPTTGDGTQLDDEDIALSLSLMTGIPISRLGTDERAKYAGMVEALRLRIIGQDDAVLAVSRAVKTARVGLKEPKRPIGSFLFLGPTGVGKTELSKALAEFMFGDETALLELDMSEYQQEHAAARLIGAPPGYVGYEGGGQLTDYIRQKPYSIVLFDEVEKAHPRVLDLLLQMMEEGRLTDGQGRTSFFNEAVIILTSNLGSEFLAEPFVDEQDRDRVMGAVRSFFRPEFLNRLDDIIVFHALSADDLRRILDLMLKKEVELLAPRGLQLEVDPEARNWLLVQNDHPEWGARPLRRLLQKHLREPLADAMLLQEIAPGTVVRVSAGEKDLVFSMSAGAS